MKAYDLRPLGIGEILDRAVTLFVGRFASLVLILALITVPLAIVQYLAQPDTAALLGDLQRLLSVPPGDTAQRGQILRQISAASALSGWVYASIGFALLAAPLGSTACIIALREAYGGRDISVRAVYAEAARRWPAQIGTGLLFVGILLLAIVAASLVFLVFALAIGAVSVLSHPAGIVVGIPLGILAFAVIFAGYALAYLTYQLAVISIAIDEPNPIRATGRAVQQAFARTLFWRSLAVAVIVLVVQTVGIYLCIALGAGLALVTHLSALYPVIVTVGGVMLSAFLASYYVVYSFDIRVRREGYDLAVALQADS